MARYKHIDTNPRLLAVDASRQIIVEAQAFGTGSEQECLLPVVAALTPQLTTNTLLTADAGYHSEANLAALTAVGIDALIADGQLRSRDERFVTQAAHRAKPTPLHALNTLASHYQPATAAGTGPAFTSRLLTGSTQRLSPSNERAPGKTRSPGSPKTTSSVAVVPPA